MADFSVSDLATSGIATDAIKESVNSGLPGRENGPADAYRHLLLSAELTRQFGETYARAALDFHEWDGNRVGQAVDTNKMDVRNNELGIALGKRLAAQPSSSWHDVIDGARTLIDQAPQQPGGAQWLDESRWQKNPTGEDGRRLANNDPSLNWPPVWPEGPFLNPAGRDAGEPYTDEPTKARSMDHMVPPGKPEKDLFDRLREEVEKAFDNRYGQLQTGAPKSQLAQAPGQNAPESFTNNLSTSDQADYQKLLTGVQKTGRWDERESENIAASLLLEVKRDPMIKQVDAVAASDPSMPNTSVFAAYTPNPQGPNFHVRVDANVAAATPAQDTLQQVAKLDQQLAEQKAQQQSQEAQISAPKLA
ncbi:XVIPCD domain-containing protein [Lysobacter capsici]|uniref:XVIPCD domain-containing protein n=1 Tax=Lysobacter capsici TaxID=435897 RepID=UPI00287B86E6|nr:XVIPCD domain-containing protein [Lysobacter capsici]WND81304.1 hypothetical protein RJ610_02690 [Lysobacter capsici]WND86500.1 hypothetical protein RJ609_02690 [Lysobacter capsici]